MTLGFLFPQTGLFFSPDKVHVDRAHDEGSSRQCLHVKRGTVWAPLVPHTQENAASPSILPFSARGTYSDLPSSSPATCGWEMLPVFSIHRLKAQDPQKSPFRPTTADDLIASSSFLAHNAQYARGTLFYFLVAMSPPP